MMIQFTVYDSGMKLIERMLCYDDVPPDALRDWLVEDADYPPDIIVMRE